MRLGKVCGQHFMGSTFSLDLAALNIIFGEIDTGKTRIGNLIKLLLLGFLPGVDKKPRAIFERLASGSRMDIEGAFDNGEGIHRSWEEKGETIKTAKHVPQLFDETIPLILLDPADYFDRSARGRIEMVFSVAKIEGGVIAAGELPENVNRAFLEAKVPVTAKSAPGGIQQWIETALELIEEARSASSAEVRRWTQTMTGLTALQLNERAATRSVEDIDADIERERNSAAEKRASITTVRRERDRAEEIALQRDDLNARIKAAGDPPEKDFDIDALRKSETELSSRLNRARSIAQAYRLWQEREASRSQQLTQAEKIVERVGKEIEEAKTINARIAVLEPPPKQEICSKCRQPITRGTPAHPDAIPLRKRLGEIASSTPEKLNDAQMLVARLKIEEKEPEKPTEDVAALEKELGKIRDEIAEYVRTADVQSWRRQLAELPKVEETDKSAEIAKLNEEITAHASAIEKLTQERRLAESDRADRKRLAEAESEQEKAIAAETRFKEAKAFLIGKKAELIEKVFGPLLFIAERFTRDIFPQPVEFRDGELGVFIGSKWVTEPTFGGARRAMLHASLQCALGVQSPCRVIIIDELGKFSRRALALFLRNVVEAHKAGAFEQFVGMMPEMPDGTVSGFTLIEATGKNYVTK